MSRMINEKHATICVAFSWVMGVALGHILTKRSLGAQYEQMAIKEIASAREFYKNLYVEKFEDPDDEEIRERQLSLYREMSGLPSENELEEKEAAEEESESEYIEAATEALTNYAGISVGKSSLEQEKEIVASKRRGKKVIPETPPALTDEEEVEKELELPRTAEDIEEKAKEVLSETTSLKNYQPPHVIDRDTFLESKSEGYEHVVLTFYPVDNVFTDYAEMVVTPARIKQVIGTENLSKFGLVSGLRNLLHVRCPQFKMDFEINRAEGKSYRVEILGEEDDE